MIEAQTGRPPRWIFVSLGIGAYAALVAAAPSPGARALLAAPMAFAAVAWWTLAKAHRWVGAFIASAILLPPLPIPLGDSGPHPSLLFAALGAFAGVLYLRDWRITAGPLERALICLFSLLVASAGVAVFYSGPEIGGATLARVLLFGIGVYLFFFVAYARGDGLPPRVAPLYWAAVASAAIACVDFYYQLPAPAGFGAQFVWLGSGVFRRAQGIFYEASTLGNFCAFFLVMIAVAFTRGRKHVPLSRPALVAGGVVLFAALLFSYSRSSIVNLLVALAALVWLDHGRIRWRRAILMLAFLAIAGAAVSYYFLPQLVETAWLRLSQTALYFFDHTEAVFSGRFESWRVLLRFLSAHPWNAVFGIGYKTLPYSDYIGQTVIGDNMYLSMLVETGVIGLTTLLWFNFSILRAAWRAARHAAPIASFLGTWMFCFWTGQLFQMFSADLLTYWRVLPVYFLVLAWAVRERRRAPEL
jgi:O-antigen ligase